MKVFLSRWTECGAISIATSGEGRYHLVWRNESIASESTVQAVMARASRGPLRWPQDGSPIRPFGPLRRWADWSVSPAPVNRPAVT
jgi:hypothetical protein